MPNRLQPLNAFDFTGGINLRPETFQLLENELPVLFNMEIDPRGGLNIRKGWKALPVDPVTEQADWDPRNGWASVTSLGDRIVMVANGTTGQLYGQLNGGNFGPVGTTGADAVPHVADFAAWNDNVWIVRGTQPTLIWSGSGAPTQPVVSGGANWQDDYLDPGVGLNAVSGDLIAQHSGYMFVASTTEDSVRYPNRLRWSHSNNPGAWHSEDFIDLSEGGQKITALIPYSDRLVIFKPDSVWALFGYDAETWELTNISRTVGCIHQQAICRNESGVFFASWPQGIFAYTERGNVDELSVPIRTVFQDQWMQPSAIHNCWLGWVDRRLWCSLPYNAELPGPDDARTVFVWDPSLSGSGSWTMFRGADNCVPGPYLERADTDRDTPLVAFVRQFPYVIVLDEVSSAAVDECVPTHVHGFSTRMRTRWLDAGAPTWKKSWRRPDFLLRGMKVNTLINCRVFHNYDNSNAQRSFTVEYTPDNLTALWGSFVWGDGTLYGGSDQTSSIERGSTMGRAGVVQIELTGASGVSWGLNGIVFKFIPRRFR